jgi:hypothetical protein
MKGEMETEWRGGRLCNHVPSIVTNANFIEAIAFLSSFTAWAQKKIQRKTDGEKGGTTPDWYVTKV